MSNYTIVTSFVTKDSLASGNPAKLVKGADFTTEFTAVQTAVNTKVDGATQFFPDGTATQPSVGFASITGTGLYNSAGALALAVGGANALTLSAAGAVVIAAPTAIGNTGLQVSGSSGTGDTALVVHGGTTAGARGADIWGGTALTDWALIVRNAAGTILWNFTGDGSHFAQGVAGGGQGAGSINANSIFIGGAQIFAGAPTNGQAGNYTAVLTDANKAIVQSSASSTLTIPANASVAYPTGTFLTFIANGTSTSIAINSDSLRLAGTASTGTRTLAANGIATAYKFAATTWIISGTGLT